MVVATNNHRRRGVAEKFVTREFEVAPGGDLDETVWGQRPGDEHRVFVVLVGGYEAQKIAAVFVGNRLAAYQYEVEYNRYSTTEYEVFGTAEVVEWDDVAIGNPVGVSHLYRRAWIEVEFTTTVDVNSGRIVSDPPPDVSVRNDADPEIVADRNIALRSTVRGRKLVQAVTRGPDGDIDRVRETHAASVNRLINAAD